MTIRMVNFPTATNLNCLQHISQLREKKAKTNIDTSARDEQIERITELQDFIKKQSTELTEFDENLARRWLKKITIYEDKYTVEFKSGVSVDIEG